MEPAALDELIEFWALLDEVRALVAGRRARPRWGSAMIPAQVSAACRWGAGMSVVLAPRLVLPSTAICDSRGATWQTPHAEDRRSRQRLSAAVSVLGCPAPEEVLLDFSG
jgi:hypothetical protein